MRKSWTDKRRNEQSIRLRKNSEART
jgi:hypothetical protein